MVPDPAIWSLRPRPYAELFNNTLLIAECRASSERLQTSRRVVSSRMFAVASRTRRIMSLVPHVLASTHSSQGRYAVSLAHGRGASGPSMERMTDPTVIFSGGLLSWYPPPRPGLLSTMPVNFKDKRICSRNFLGIASCSAMVVTRVGPCP